MSDVTERSVMMLGGRGAGKSTLLGSIFDQSATLESETGLRIKVDQYSTGPLIQKVETMRAVTQQKLTDTVNPFEFPRRPNADIESFTFEIGTSSQNSRLDLTFVDMPGGWMSEDKPKLYEIAKKSHAAILAIDTVELMEQESFPTEALTELRNQPKQLRETVKYWLDHFLDDGNESTFLLLCLVLVKVETYLRKYVGDNNEARSYEAVLEKVKDEYKEVLAELKKREKNVAVVITPIETLGNVVWDHYESAGMAYPKEFFRRVEGSTDGGRKALGYCPNNCDLPLRYILNFFLIQQIRSEILKREPKKIESIIDSFVNYVSKLLINIFPDFNKSKLEKIFRSFSDVFSPERSLISAVWEFTRGVDNNMVRIIQGERLLIRDKPMFQDFLNRLQKIGK